MAEKAISEAEEAKNREQKAKFDAEEAKKEAMKARYDAEEANIEAVKAQNSAQEALKETVGVKEKTEEANCDAIKARTEVHVVDSKTFQSEPKKIQSEAVKPQIDRKVGQFLRFGSLQQCQELEENEFIDDDEIEYVENKTVLEVLNCPICNKDFDNNEKYGEHIKKNYSFCTKCSHLFLNEAELKKHMTSCNKCEVCGRDNHKGDCLKKKSSSNKGKKRK